MVHRPEVGYEVAYTVANTTRSRDGLGMVFRSAAVSISCLGFLAVLSLSVEGATQGSTTAGGRPSTARAGISSAGTVREAGARAERRDTNATKWTKRRVASWKRSYRSRSAKLAKTDVVGHYALAEWCTEKNLPQCARWEIHEVLREAPDHAGARGLLGQVFANGEWIDRDIAMRAKGLVRFDGRWVRPYEASKLRHQREHALAIQHKANLLFARLADRNARTRTEVRRELEALAEAEAMPKVADVARRFAKAYDNYWKSRQAREGRTVTSYTGILGVNVTHSKLLGMDTLSTSLGVGSPVKIQLPRMQTISVGTTVAVPLGRR